MDQHVLVGLPVHEHADVLAGDHLVVVGPGLEIVGIGQAHAVLLEAAPPLVGMILVGEEIGINHAPHFADGHVGAFDAQQFRLAPVLQVLAGHLEDAGVLVRVRIVYRAGVRLGPEQPLVAVANDVAGAGVVEIEVAWRKELRLGPGDEIGAFGDGKLIVDPPPGLAPNLAVEHAEDALVVVPGRVAVADVAIAPQKDGVGNGVPVNSSLGLLGFCLCHRCSPLYRCSPL